VIAGKRESIRHVRRQVQGGDRVGVDGVGRTGPRAVRDEVQGWGLEEVAGLVLAPPALVVIADAGPALDPFAELSVGDQIGARIIGADEHDVVDQELRGPLHVEVEAAARRDARARAVL